MQETQKIQKKEELLIHKHTMSKDKLLNSIDDLKARNLYNSLTNDQKNIFYAMDRITNGLIKKAKMSLYPKDKVFVKIFTEVRNIKNINKKTPLNTPFVERKTKKKNKMLTIRPYTVLTVLLRCYRQILQTFDS